MKKTLIALAVLAASCVVNAQDLTAQSQAQSASQAGASSGSMAAGNVITLNQNTPAQMSTTSSNRAEQILSGGTTNTDNVRYSGVVENRASGGYSNTETLNQNISGTQTLKNVPSIAMSGPASGPCTGVSGGISAAGPGFGVGINGSAVMVDCRLRENARVLGMAMQSFDGVANPQEKGEVTVMFMDSLRALAGYTDKLVSDEKITPRNRK